MNVPVRELAAPLVAKTIGSPVNPRDKQRAGGIGTDERGSVIGRAPRDSPARRSLP
jgi:hypothetical protein